MLNTTMLVYSQTLRLSATGPSGSESIGELLSNSSQESASSSTAIIAMSAFLMLAIAIILFLWYYNHNTKNTQRMLQQMHAARENFFTNVTHEFRTPLTVILGLSQELEKTEGNKSEEVRTIAKRITRQGNSLLALINQLLEMSKVRSPLVEPKWMRGDIIPFIAMVVDNFQPYADIKRQELSFKHQLTTFEMDFVPDFIQKTLSNLITNAIKYTDKYGKIGVSLECQGNQSITIKVADNGQGIDEKTLPHIFESFYQGGNSSAEASTGVGLSLVKLMVEGMEGSITAESTINEGSTFTIVLPVNHKRGLEKLEDPDQYLTSPQLADFSEQVEVDFEKFKPCKQCTILIIEDNQDIAYYIGKHLSSCKLIYSRNAIDGMTKAEETMPDLIITDIMMQGSVSGLEFCRQIRSNELLNHIPIIIITAKDSEKDRIEGLKAGADAYITKPFNPEVLMVRVQKLLERQKMLKEKFMQMNEVLDTKSKSMSTADRQFLNKMVDIVYKQMAKGNVDVESIANELAVSRSQLNRKMLALTNQNTSNYIMQLRLSRAKRLLKANVNTPISDVAQKCGFDDTGYFSRIFKQTFNMTPSQYRKQQ